MRIATLRIASIVVIGLLPTLVFVISSWETLSLVSAPSFLSWDSFTPFSESSSGYFCNLFENYKLFSPIGLYLVYGGFAFVLIGITCNMIIPAIHSFGPQWVFPD